MFKKTSLRRKLKGLSIKLFCKRKKITITDTPSFSGAWPYISNKGVIRLGGQCSFRSFRLHQTITVQAEATLEIGEGSFFNDGVNICASQSIKIGRNAKIGDMTYVFDTDFHQLSPDRDVKKASVVIGNNVWVGANSMILAGSSIGDNSVIAAGSIVVGEIPPNCLAAGTPAKVIKSLNIPDGWLRQ
ncbi:acyltransferase [Shewanella pealeana]|uniref:Acetyltransferase (Isoleucine patch superfamily)-like protein n=1 Tax=Shewanella pealeana (strain ATCC 700345 / ANG-SQ1) TaxID=398579 RepID=A8H2P8_SHEPA|nr:acyltransferase [Shewanella pealeana]ABV86835.1 Acetyltransferase (isoleucine patch superfamily)-like protein [Shewanella pealeana ATCC 700345]